MKLKIMLVAVFMATFIGLRSQHVSAHVLAESNGVTAVLHIPPYDSPVAGEATTFQFEFGTDAGGFHISDYHVSVTASAPGVSTITEPVVAPFLGASGVGTATMHFPVGAVYSVTLTGTAQHASDPSFVTHYNVRVTPGKSSATQSNGASLQTLLIGLAVFAIFGMVATRQVIAGKRYAQPKRSTVRPKKNAKK